MPMIDRTEHITTTEERRIQSFTDWAWRLSAKMRTDCERKGIDPENCPILGDFTAVLGALEYFIQEHHKNGLQ